LKENAQKEASKIIEEAKKEALVQKEQIEEFANKEKDKIISEATISGKTIIETAETEAEKIKISMLQSVRANVLDLALKLNSKIF
jgi:F0F1-type ATP synthase membrane subunit b/b'